jgi:hypothetical protein
MAEALQAPIEHIQLICRCIGGATSKRVRDLPITPQALLCEVDEAPYERGHRPPCRRSSSGLAEVCDPS